MRHQKDFTLVELFIVVAVLIVLLALVIIAIDPAQQFQQANDIKRKGDVNTILNAIEKYQTAHNGMLPKGITTDGKIKPISKPGVNLCDSLVPTYIQTLPTDPNINNGSPVTSPCPEEYATGYSISSKNGHISVYATGEIAKNIKVTE